MSKLWVVLRTCDKQQVHHGSLQDGQRIVHKTECVIRCLNSVLNNLKKLDNIHLHIIDDNSGEYLRNILKELTKGLSFVSFNFLSPSDISRQSVKSVYEYISNIPDEDLVYVLEDDYLHEDDAFDNLLTAWNYLNTLTAPHIDVGIFPQCFVQLFPYPENPLADFYDRGCSVVPTPVGFYRTTWYTNETYILQSKIFKKYKHIFDLLQTTDTDDSLWEGNTISQIWSRDDFKMFMPLSPSVVHMSLAKDKPFYWSNQRLIDLWNYNQTSYSLPENSWIKLL